MSSHQAARIYFVFLSLVYLSYELACGDLAPVDSLWLAGYQVIFLFAAVKAATSYVCLELDTLLERTRLLQYAALSTTSKGQVLALHREERLSRSQGSVARYSLGAFGRGEQIQFNPHYQYSPAPVFWCTLVGLLVLYNTIHLAAVPLSHTSPLFFGTPAYVCYWGTVRTSQLLLDRTSFIRPY